MISPSAGTCKTLPSCYSKHILGKLAAAGTASHALKNHRRHFTAPVAGAGPLDEPERVVRAKLIINDLETSVRVSIE